MQDRGSAGQQWGRSDHGPNEFSVRARRSLPLFDGTLPDWPPHHSISSANPELGMVAYVL